MAYESSSNAFVGWALETTETTHSADGVALPTLPPPPSTFALCGYCPLPDRRKGLNNSVGYATGKPGGAYRAHGNRTPGLTVTARGGGALGLLTKVKRAGAVPQKLPSLCFFVGVPGQWTEVYRYGKLGQAAFQFRESSQGEAAPVEFTFTVEAITSYDLAVPISTPTAPLVNALSKLLYWHDLRAWYVTDSAGTARNLRTLDLMGASSTIAHKIERKGGRHDWGAHIPLSRTNTQLLEHEITVSGQMDLHGRMNRAYFETASNSLDWGDIVFNISDAPTVSSDAQTVTVTLKDCIPQDETGSAVEPGAQIGTTVPFAACDFDIVVS